MPPTTSGHLDTSPQLGGREMEGTPNYLVGSRRVPPPPACTLGAKAGEREAMLTSTSAWGAGDQFRRAPSRHSHRSRVTLCVY